MTQFLQKINCKGKNYKLMQVRSISTKKIGIPQGILAIYRINGDLGFASKYSNKRKEIGIVEG